MFKFPFHLIKPSRQYLSFQSSRNLSIFHYRLHYQSQSDHKVSFDWNVCQNFQDICYYFEKNYVKKYIIDQNKNSQSITTKNTFTLKDIFLYQDHLELLERTSIFIGTFDVKNEEHCALLALLLDNLNRDLQYLFYNRTIQITTRGLLLNQVVQNILNILQGVLGKMNDVVDSSRKTQFQDQIAKLLLNHNFIGEISTTNCQKYLDIVHNLNLFNQKDFERDFLNTFVLIGLQKALNMRDQIVQSDKFKGNKIVNKLNEQIFNNIDQIESYDELFNTISLLRQEGSSQRVINYSKYAENIYQQFAKIASEKADAATIARRNHSIFKIFQIIDLTSPPKFNKIMACFKNYSDKFLQIETFSALPDGVVDEFVGIFKAVYQKFLTADPAYNKEILSIFSKYIIALRDSERIELKRLLKIIELLQSMRRLDSELVSQIYEDIYEIFLSRSFNKILQEIKRAEGLKELNLLSSRLAKILPEVYPEEKWQKINVQNLSYENQILAISCLHPLVDIPQEFFVFSEEKAVVLENEPLYYVKLLRFEMDERFQSYLKTYSKIHLKKGLKKYALDIQFDIIKELISARCEQSTTTLDGKLVSLAKDLIKQSFESLNSNSNSSTLIRAEDLFFVMHKSDLFRNQELYDKTRQYTKDNAESVSPLAMARLFQYFSESGNLTETDLSFFQDYFIKRLRSLGPDEFYAISVAVRNVRLKPQFYHEFTELVKNRSSNPEYLSMICEFVYHELKSKNHRSVFLDRYVSRMKTAMEADPSFVTFYDLDRMIPYIMKFKEVDWLLKIYLKKLDMFLQQPKVHHLCQVYCNFTKISDDKAIIEKLEKIVRMHVDSFSSFEITRIISSLTQRYEHNANIELLNLLLDKTMQEGFFAKKADDSAGSTEIISKNVDIGILSIVFLQHCLILKNSSLPFLQKALKLIKAIIGEKEGGLSTSSYSDNKYNMKHNILDIHVNQILQGILILKNVKKMDFQNEFEDLAPKLENLWKSFETNKNTFQNKSYFQAEVWYFLKKLLPNLEKELPIPPFSADFYWKDEQLLVECHGSHHFIYNGKILRFNEKRRTQVLEALGYKVVIVPIHEWRATPRVKRLEYLKNKIQAVGVKCNSKIIEEEQDSMKEKSE